MGAGTGEAGGTDQGKIQKDGSAGRSSLTAWPAGYPLRGHEGWGAPGREPFLAQEGALRWTEQPTLLPHCVLRGMDTLPLRALAGEGLSLLSLGPFFSGKLLCFP